MDVRPMITISTSYIQAGQEKNGLSNSRADKKISKREAAIFIDSFPMVPMYKHRPQVIYRRVSKQRYKSAKPKYGPPTKYRSAKPWTPSKKYRRTVKPKYGPPKVYKRYPPKPKYGPPKPISHKPIYGPPKKIPLSSFYPPEPVGFGEPPVDNMDYQPPKQSFGEPPVDSYGEPVHADIKDLYIPEQYSQQAISYPDTFTNFHDFNQNIGQDFKSWQRFQNDQNLNIDSNVAYSKVRPIFVKPDQSFVTRDKDFDLLLQKAYLHKYKQREVNKEEEPLEKKIPHYAIKKRTTTKPRRLHKSTTPEPEEEEVLVGGRYAEPPERYVPNFTIAHYSNDEDFSPLRGFIDPDTAISATMSPYVNYKNSNMAFSPQNLNDAFSIVDN